MNGSNYNDPMRGFMIVLACLGIYLFISKAVDGFQVIFNLIFG